MQKQSLPSWPGWETVRLIGRGSFGAVYEIQRDVLGDVESAALKVISIPQSNSDLEEMYSDGYDEESITSTFRAHLKSIVGEYSLMRKMNGSSNIVSCDDIRYIQHDDGIGWDILIKMELLTPLVRTLPGEIPESVVIRIAKDLCAALDLCKKYDIVHRDIKPQNIFVSHNGDYKLGDFGIAKTVEKTMGGTKIGTYKYMAPEVYNNQPYSSTADIYSLGLVLYWMLNERRMPFMPLPPEKLSAGMEERARLRRFSGEPMPHPAHGSEELKEIVMKACAYDPKDRFDSAAAMLAALEQMGEHKVVYMDVAPAFPIAAADSTGRTEYEDDDRTVGLFRKYDVPVIPADEPETQTDMLPEAEASSQTPETVQKGDSKAEESTKQAHELKRRKRRWFAVLGVIVALLALTMAVFFGGRGKENDEVLQNQDGGTGEEESVVSAATWPNDTIPAKEETIPPTEPVELAPIIAVDAAWTHVVALRADGTVSVVIESGMDEGQGDTSEWTDIVAVCAGHSHTVGLKSDGTVVAVGSDSYGQLDVSGWRDIVAIAAGDHFTAGLCKDGTVVAVGDTRWGQCDTAGLQDIVFIDASDDLLFCLDNDEVLTIIGKQYGRHEMETIRDCASVSVSLHRSVALEAEKTAHLVTYMREEEKQYDVSEWRDLSAVDAGLNQIVGLRTDGRVEVVGKNEYGECDVTEWTSVVDICAAHGYTVGVRADGTVVATGKYISTGTACDVSELNRLTKLIPEEEQHVFPESSWSDWVTGLPAGVDSENYEIEQKTQYSYYIISEQDWLQKGSWLCQECAVTPGEDRYVVDGVTEEWDSCLYDEDGNRVCEHSFHIGFYDPPPVLGGATSTSYEYFLEPVTQYRYRDLSTDGTYGEWSAWQFDAVSDSDTRQTETRTVYRQGRIATTTTHYHCHPVWSSYSDEVVANNEDTVVCTRTVYRYRKRT